MRNRPFVRTCQSLCQERQDKLIRNARGPCSTGKRLQPDGPREEDVVLEMNVLVQILLEFLQALIERVKGRAGTLRSGEIPAQAADFSNQRSLGQEHGFYYTAGNLSDGDLRLPTLSNLNRSFCVVDTGNPVCYRLPVIHKTFGRACKFCKCYTMQISFTLGLGL